MTNREINRAVCEVIKDAGYKRREFSVKVTDAGLETSINIEIKNPLLRKTEIEPLFKKFSSVDQDYISGEILAGGNTFVFVDYADGIFTEAEKGIEAAREILEGGESSCVLADGDKKEVVLTKFNDFEWLLKESNKDKPVSEYHKPCWIRGPKKLAIALWRFRNIGTIYD